MSAPLAEREFPVDLVFNVFEHLASDKPFLSACCHVCKAWVAPSRYHLFRTITAVHFRGDARLWTNTIEPRHRGLRDFLAFLEDNPSIGSYIRTLTLQPAYNLQPQFNKVPQLSLPMHFLVDAMQRLPALETLHLRAVHVIAEADSCEWTPPAPASIAVKTVIMSCIRVAFHSVAYAEIFHLFPSMEHFKLEFVAVPRPEDARNRSIKEEFKLNHPLPVELSLNSLEIGDAAPEYFMFPALASTQSVASLRSVDVLSPGDWRALRPVVSNLVHLGIHLCTYQAIISRNTTLHFI